MKINSILNVTIFKKIWYNQVGDYMEIQGKVASGLGVAKHWIKKIEKIFYNKIGETLYQGTLNIKLDFNYEFKPDIIISKNEYDGEYDVYVKKCKLLEREAYIVRSGKNIDNNGDHKLNIIEIMSNVNFRKEYKLRDGETVKIIVK